METSRLKNIVILILLLLNIFLAATLLLLESSQYSYVSRLEAELRTLFEADGVSLGISLPTDAIPNGYALSISSTAKQMISEELLGGSPAIFDEVDATRYQSNLGQAIFYDDGIFSVSGQLASGDAKTFCLRFCQTHGYREPEFSLDETQSGSAHAQLFMNGLPVQNAAVSFLIEENQVIAVSGTYFSAETPLSENTKPLNAATALSRFLDARQESGAVVSSVNGMYLCYEVQHSASSAFLIPSWCIQTDTVNYYVNCQTGVVSHD